MMRGAILMAINSWKSSLQAYGISMREIWEKEKEGEKERESKRKREKS